MSRLRVRWCRRLQNERGHALMLALVAASLLVSMGSALANVSVSETLISAHYRDTAQLRYAADAALARALVDLEGHPDWRLAGEELMSGLRDGAAPGLQLVGGAAVDPVAEGALLHTTAPGPWRPFAWGTADDLFGAPGPALFVIVWVSGGGAPDPDALWLVARAYAGGGGSGGVAVRVVRGASGRSRLVTWHEVR